MAETTEKKVSKKTGLYQEDTYKVTLPLTSEKQADVVVIINGQATQIQRGKEVTVSAGVYEVLKNSERMDMIAILRQRELSGE